MPATASLSSKPAGVRKMRKGTKSCLPCRRRKIRCSGLGAESRPCIECSSRGTADCIAQGESDDHAASDEMQRLQERVAELEAHLQRVTREHSRAHVGTKSHQTSARPVSQPTAHGTNHEEEDQVATRFAPIVSLLNASAATASPATVLDGTEFTRNEDTSESQRVLRTLRSHLPPEVELDDILKSNTSWWPLYRDSLGLIWTGCDTLRSFAAHALMSSDPAVTALLLVSIAISTGDLRSYLPPVERLILDNDQYAGTEHGLNCLMAVGLCYMSNLQPRRAWTVYRRANTLLQLSALHLRRRSEKHDSLFWQLFHADRWVSLMIGLPYTILDHFCDLEIAPLQTLGPGTWLYRHLGIITGRVIDHLQAQTGTGPTLSSALMIEERITGIIAELPSEYLDMDAIRECTDTSEKNTRLYRVVHVHQLRTYIHLPFFFVQGEGTRHDFSRRSCVEDSRKLLIAYLQIYDDDPCMAADGTILNFTAFTAAVVVLLGLVGHGRPHTANADITRDRGAGLDLVLRTRDAVKYGARTSIAGRLCAKCYTALEELILSVQTPSVSSHSIVLPYFGTLSITSLPCSTIGTTPAVKSRSARRPQSNTEAIMTLPTASAASTLGIFTNSSTIDGAKDGLEIPSYGDLDTSMSSFTYQGPFLVPDQGSQWLFDSLPRENMDWMNASGQETDWSWLYADLPPNVI